MTDYTIERLNGPEDFDESVVKYLYEEAPKISELFENVFNYENFSPLLLANKAIFLVGKRNGEVRGHMIACLSRSPLDTKITMLEQISFYVKPDSGRTAYCLFSKFLDIGKSEANHIITMLTRHSNIKPSTLEKLGFKEMEVVYRLEVK